MPIITIRQITVPYFFVREDIRGYILRHLFDFVHRRTVDRLYGFYTNRLIKVYFILFLLKGYDIILRSESMYLFGSPIFYFILTMILILTSERYFEDAELNRVLFYFHFLILFLILLYFCITLFDR